MVDRIAAPVSSVGWDCDSLAATDAGRDYFTDQPEAACAELAALVEEIRAGFRQLEARMSHSPDATGR